MSDEELVLARAFVNREAWAYDAAYRAHGGMLYSAALQVLRDAGDAADCVQDVLLRLWRRGDAYRLERGALRAFLAVCVRNEALSRLRKARGRDRIGQTLDRPSATGDIAASVVDRESIRGALETLTPKQRETIELAYMRHMTHEEIASKLGEPTGTVKSRLSSALRKLRETFTPEEAFDAG
ncbi:MAG TPA: sigma-70 family RNA polymerase sigma factor [Candidatus Baltobacteraceae bacterium]|nr:sigma-70 family RNA polymerase sigma factor [Candidatus Baltobacteraceae bacterium]